MKFRIPLLLEISIAVPIAISAGFRNENVGEDTLAYIDSYNQFGEGGYKFELFYYLLEKFFSTNKFPVGFFFCLISFIGIFFLLRTTREINYTFYHRNDNLTLVLIFLILLASPFFYSVEFNVIRHGVSIFALICSIVTFASSKKKLQLVVAAIFAAGFHYTGIIYLIICFALLHTKWLWSVAVGSFAIIYFTGLTGGIIERFSNITGIDIYNFITEYGVAAEYKSGFRIDFLLFSIALGLVLELQSAPFIWGRDKFIRNLIKIYWLLLVPFLLFGFGAFSDRFLIAPWIYFSIIFAFFLRILLNRQLHLIASQFLLIALIGLFFIRSQDFLR